MNTISMSSIHALRPVNPGNLTDRECQIVGLIARGHSNQEIADQLYLSINSVKTYIRSAYRRIGVTRRTQAVVWAMTHGLHEDDPDQATG